jgi:hypothetical protein
MLDPNKTSPEIQSSAVNEKFEEFAPIDSDLITKRVLKLQLHISGLTFGLLFAMWLFFASVWLLIKGGESVGTHLSLLHYYLPGYSVTWFGSLVGALYGLLYGYVFGFSVAFIYNKIAHFRLKK